MGSDVLIGFEGNDVIWGDTPNTDAFGRAVPALNLNDPTDG